MSETDFAAFEGKNPGDRTIMHVLYGLHTLAPFSLLSLSVVAEGVETAAHLHTLKVMGCDLYQGYLLSPALPADQFAANFLRPA